MCACYLSHEWKKFCSIYVEYILNWEQRQLDLVGPYLCSQNAKIGNLELFNFVFSKIQNRLFFYAVNLNCDFSNWFSSDNAFCKKLPFQTASMSLLVLPHFLELSQEPYAFLSEITRIIAPGGYLILTGLNPDCLYNFRNRFFSLCTRFGSFSKKASMPLNELQKYLELLNFELYTARFGCYRPCFHKSYWYHKFACMELIGERWFPMSGSVFFIVAAKRHGYDKFLDSFGR